MHNSSGKQNCTLYVVVQHNVCCTAALVTVCHATHFYTRVIGLKYSSAKQSSSKYPALARFAIQNPIGFLKIKFGATLPLGKLVFSEQNQNISESILQVLK